MFKAPIAAGGFAPNHSLGTDYRQTSHFAPSHRSRNCVDVNSQHAAMKSFLRVERDPTIYGDIQELDRVVINKTSATSFHKTAGAIHTRAAAAARDRIHYETPWFSRHLAHLT